MDVRSIFAEHDMRCTKQRMVIFEALNANASHPTAEDLFEEVQSECPGLSLATVYNTLEALCSARLCRKLPVTSGSARYDADTSTHMHAVDTVTGKVFDVPVELGSAILDNLPEAVIHQIEQNLNLKIDRVSIQFIGKSNHFPQQRESEPPPPPPPIQGKIDVDYNHLL